MRQTAPKQPHKNQPVISKPEKIIILVAYIVIVAMFTYTVITTGLFSDGENSEPETAGIDSGGAWAPPQNGGAPMSIGGK